MKFTWYVINPKTAKVMAGFSYWDDALKYSKSHPSFQIIKDDDSIAASYGIEK